MENNKLLSFVIPVYNVEAYLHECIDSILCQMNDSCEMILVDDGSTDSSGDICDEYKIKSNNIKVIHKENGGLSSARNVGLLVAKGEYIAFIDSDDMISPCCVGKMLDWISKEDADLCFMQTIKFYPNGSIEDMNECIEKKYLYKMDKICAIQHLSTRPKYPGSACSKMYRREFILDNNIHFPYDKRFSEDLGFVRDCILFANKYDYLGFPYYRYRKNRKGSITNKITYKNFEDLNIFIEESIDLLIKCDNEISKCFMRFVAYEYAIMLLMYNDIPNNSKQNALTILKKNKWVLNYSYGPKMKLINLLCLVLGIEKTALVVKMIKNLQKGKK